MRLDKFLKNSRLIKRRTLAKEACEKGLVEINDELAKPSDSVNIDDIISLQLAREKLGSRLRIFLMWIPRRMQRLFMIG